MRFQCFPLFSIDFNGFRYSHWISFDFKAGMFANGFQIILPESVPSLNSPNLISYCWISLDFYRFRWFLWISFDFNWFRWISLDVTRFRWFTLFSLDFNGFQWISRLGCLSTDFNIYNYISIESVPPFKLPTET